MHELSIAINILEIAEESAKQNNCKSFSSIQLEIGKQAGIVIEAMEFALEEVMKGTVLDGCKVEILEIDAIMKCEACQHQFPIEELYTPCPKCGSFAADLIQGNELSIKKLVV